MSDDEHAQEAEEVVETAPSMVANYAGQFRCNAAPVEYPSAGLKDPGAIMVCDVQNGGATMGLGWDGSLALHATVTDDPAKYSTAADCNGWSALHACAINGHLAILTLLVDNGGDVFAKVSQPRALHPCRTTTRR